MVEVVNGLRIVAGHLVKVTPAATASFYTT